MRKTLPVFVLAVAILFVAMLILNAWLDVALWPYIHFPKRSFQNSK
jgi:hypothetical protein